MPRVRSPTVREGCRGVSSIGSKSCLQIVALSDGLSLPKSFHGIVIGFQPANAGGKKVAWGEGAPRRNPRKARIESRKPASAGGSRSFVQYALSKNDCRPLSRADCSTARIPRVSRDHAPPWATVCCLHSQAKMHNNGSVQKFG